VCIYLVWYALQLLRKRISGPDVSEPSCGSCGYPVRGLPSSICPECGRDVNEVGIIEPDVPRRPGVILPVLVWTCMLPILALLISNMVFRRLPFTYEPFELLTLYEPSSKAYLAVMLKATGQASTTLLQGFPRSVIMQKLEMVLYTQQGESLCLKIDLPSLEVKSQNPDSITTFCSDTLTETGLLEWMHNTGVDIEDERVKAETDEIMAVIEAARTRTMGTVSCSHFLVLANRSYWGPRFLRTIPRWWTLIAGGIWLIVWIFGIWYFFHRRHIPSSAT